MHKYRDEMTPDNRRATSLAPSLILVIVAVLVLGCESFAPSTAGLSTSPVPTAAAGPAELGIDWARVASVDRPGNYEATVPPNYPGNHPILRIQGQATMSDIAGLSGGGFVAVGYVPPDWVPVSWTSATGSDWMIHSIEPSSFTFPVSLAVGSTGTVAAVGRSGGLPVAWTSADGVAWERHSFPFRAISASRSGCWP